MDILQTMLGLNPQTMMYFSVVDEEPEQIPTLQPAQIATEHGVNADCSGRTRLYYAPRDTHEYQRCQMDDVDRYLTKRNIFKVLFRKAQVTREKIAQVGRIMHTTMNTVRHCRDIPYAPIFELDGCDGPDANIIRHRNAAAQPQLYRCLYTFTWEFKLNIPTDYREEWAPHDMRGITRSWEKIEQYSVWMRRWHALVNRAKEFYLQHRETLDTSVDNEYYSDFWDNLLDLFDSLLELQLDNMKLRKSVSKSKRQNYDALIKKAPVFTLYIGFNAQSLDSYNPNHARFSRLLHNRYISP